jgi:tetratricopeptide (TPR) repeat protein
MKTNLLLISLLCAASSAFATDNPTSDHLQNCQKFLADQAFSKAVDEAQSAIANSQASREIYLCLGRAQSGLGDHTSALQTFQKSDTLASSPYEHIVSLTLSGNAQKASSAYADALATYQKSAAIAHEAGIKRYEMIDLHLMGEVKQASGDAQGAMTLYEQAHKLAANDNERADSYTHLAGAARAMHKYDQAIAYQVKAVIMEERSGDSDHYVHASLELGNIYREAKQYKDADRVLDKLLGEVVQVGDAYWEAAIYEAQGMSKRDQGLSDEASRLFNKGIDLARKNGEDALVKQIEATRDNSKMM